MFRYDKKQTVFEIGGFHVGGQPGEYPTVLASSMFYDKHKVVTDAKAGEFDKQPLKRNGTFRSSCRTRQASATGTR